MLLVLLIISIVVSVVSWASAVEPSNTNGVAPVNVPKAVISVKLPVEITVPVTSGKVNVLSALGSDAVNVVSKLSSVSPSNMIDPPLKI